MLNLEKRCYNGGKRHKFKPRYTEVPSGIRLGKATNVKLKELLFYKKYVGDICVWCGKKVRMEERNGIDK